MERTPAAKSGWGTIPLNCLPIGSSRGSLLSLCFSLTAASMLCLKSYQRQTGSASHANNLPSPSSDPLGSPQPDPSLPSFPGPPTLLAPGLPTFCPVLLAPFCPGHLRKPTMSLLCLKSFSVATTHPTDLEQTHQWGHSEPPESAPASDLKVHRSQGHKTQGAGHVLRSCPTGRLSSL